MARKKRDTGPEYVRFPVITGLQVEDYGLYPGKRGKGLKATFPSGLTVVLGANGLGKTTLVWIMYRLLSGPYDIPGLDDGGDLGSRSLESRPLRAAYRKMFARRVVDDAADFGHRHHDGLFGQATPRDRVGTRREQPERPLDEHDPRQHRLRISTSGFGDLPHVAWFGRLHRGSLPVRPAWQYCWQPRNKEPTMPKRKERMGLCETAQTVVALGGPSLDKTEVFAP